MTKYRGFSLAVVVLVVLSGVATVHSFATAVEPAATSGSLLRMGPSGIMCVKEPCPWRSIGPVDAAGKSLEPQTMFTGSDGPRVVATDAVRLSVEAAWNDHRCLMIEGRLKARTLHVGRIVGDCKA